MITWHPDARWEGVSYVTGMFSWVDQNVRSHSGNNSWDVSMSINGDLCALLEGETEREAKEPWYKADKTWLFYRPEHTTVN